MVGITADKVVVELEARLGQYEANVARAEAKFDRSMTGIQRSAKATERIVATAAASFTAAFASVSVAALAQGFLQVADQAKKLDSTLKLATQTSGNFGKAQEDVRRIADTTRTGLSETAQLYANFVRNSQALGATQADAARATETFSKTLKISGASAAEAGSATLQFSQALASGALRGDELNSILEASPRLAKLLADSLGISVGQLRALGAEGQLTADKLLKALTEKQFTASIDAEFAQLPVTFEEAMTRVSNAAVIAFGAFDRGGQFSTALANFVSDGADNFADLEDAAEKTGIEIRSVFEGLGNAFQPLLNGALSAFGSIEGKAKSTRDVIAQLLGAFDDAANALPNLGNWANDFDRRVFGRQFRPDSPTSNLRGRFLQGFDSASNRLSGDAAERRFQAQFGGFDALGNPVRSSTPTSPAPVASGGGGRKRSSTRATAKDAAEDPFSLDNLAEKIEDARRIAETKMRQLERDTPFITEGLPGWTMEDIVAQADARRDAEIEANEAIEEDLRRRQDNAVHTLASVYEDAFRGGTEAIWGDFKSMGLAVIAQVLAKFTIAQVSGQGGGFNLGGALGSAVSSVFGFAGGGSFTLGGRGGADNNRLALNGRTIANVSRGESISIGNRATVGKGGGSHVVQPIIQVDARGAVMNDQFAAMILARSGQQAQQAAAAMGQGVLNAVPSRMAQFNTDGT